MHTMSCPAVLRISGPNSNPPQNSWRQVGDMKQFLIWGHTKIRCYRTKFRPGNMRPGIYAPRWREKTQCGLSNGNPPALGQNMPTSFCHFFTGSKTNSGTVLETAKWKYLSTTVALKLIPPCTYYQLKALLNELSSSPIITLHCHREVKEKYVFRLPEFVSRTRQLMNVKSSLGVCKKER
jgi:hypothetical protein